MVVALNDNFRNTLEKDEAKLDAYRDRLVKFLIYNFNSGVKDDILMILKEVIKKRSRLNDQKGLEKFYH